MAMPGETVREVTRPMSGGGVPLLARTGAWLSPGVCWGVLVGLIAVTVVLRVIYLHSPQAVGLAPDEAQYWVWSRNPDWSYYSKGPMVAWIIGASTAVFGDTMPAVRYPALMIAVGSMLLSFVLARGLFGSWRLGLGAVGLSCFVPMFIAGSMIMTIDPPFVFFWSCATACYCLAVVWGKKWAWLLAGAFVGASFLAKYSALLLLAGMALGLLADAKWRRLLLSPWPWLSVAVTAACTFPVVYWNWINGWPTAKHVKAGTAGGFHWTGPLEFYGGTLAALGPGLAVIMIAAVWAAWRGGWTKAERADVEPVAVEHARRARFLLMTVVPYGAAIFLAPWVGNAQLNWSAPLWFALLILTARFLGERLATSVRLTSMVPGQGGEAVGVGGWKPWRGFFWFTVGLGLVVMPLAHNMTALYPGIAWVQERVLGKTVRTRETAATLDALPTAERRKREVSVRRWDPTARLRGWEQLARELHERRATVPGLEDAFILVEDYSDASVLEFYMPGHPKTYVMGPFIEDPEQRGRATQWDYWPDRTLERGRTDLIGRNAIFIGHPWKVLTDSFERVERLEPPHAVYVNVGGVDYFLAGYRAYALYNFKGMPRPADGKGRW